MMKAARLDDPIAHSTSESSLLAGPVTGADMVTADAPISGIGGGVSPVLLGAVLAGAALGGGSLSNDDKPSGSITSGSPDVFVNFKPIARADADVGECSKHGPYPQLIATGSETVFINFCPAARVNDKLQCSGIIVDGSSDVIIGG